MSCRDSLITVTLYQKVENKPFCIILGIDQNIAHNAVFLSLRYLAGLYLIIWRGGLCGDRIAS